MTSADAPCKRNEKIADRINETSPNNCRHSAPLTTASKAAKPSAQHDAQQVSNPALLRLFQISFVDATQLVWVVRRLVTRI
jgi:hypothetical protein